jgi:hypothetical protein
MLSIQESLRLINLGLERIRKFRPLWKNEYSANPVLTLEQIVAFERKHSCRLPESYREFLLHVGNGGAGPEYGICKLGQHLSDSGHEECFEDNADLALPFPHAEAWNEDGLDEESYHRCEHVAGALPINDRGCALWTYLVITGPLAGEIWNDDRGDGDGIHPHLAPDGSRYQFLPWYLDWLGRRVHQYGHKGNPNPDPGPGGQAFHSERGM